MAEEPKDKWPSERLVRLKKASPLGDQKTREPQFDFILRDLYARLDERDHWDDEVTKFLLYANGGGVALTLTFAASVISRSVEFGRLMLPGVIAALVVALCFTGGIFFAGIAIFHANKAASKNRTSYRKLANDYVNRADTTYADVFLTLGTLSNKRKRFTRYCRWSFTIFVIAVLAALAVVFALAYIGAHEMALTQQTV